MTQQQDIQIRLNGGMCHALARFPAWHYFGTLTFKGKVPGQIARQKLAFAFLRDSADLLGVSFRRLYWCLRDEAGETFGRSHLHFLLGMDATKPNIALAFQLMHRWELLPCAGMARVRVFDPSLGGVDYVAECLSGGDFGANSYEVGKFAGDAVVTLGESVVSAIMRVSRTSFGGRAAINGGYILDTSSDTGKKEQTMNPQSLTTGESLCNQAHYTKCSFGKEGGVFAWFGDGREVKLAVT